MSFWFDFKVLKCKNNKKIDVDLNVNAVKDKDGKILHSISSWRDITKTTLIEGKLEESEKKYKTLFKSSSDALFLVDVENLNLIDANEKAVELYGYNYEELMRKKATDLSAEEEKTVKVLQQDFPSQIPLRYHKKKDGTVFPVEISANYFELNGRRINLSDIRDISERVESEKSLRITEAKLQQSEKMESIGNLAGGIAHDFNNILSSIIGFSDIALANVEKNSELEDDLMEINQAGKRAAELVQQILIFARKSEEKLRPIKVHPIANEALKLLRSTIPSNIEIVENIESNYTVMGNETQFHQIFMNLCTNAAQAMEKDGGALHVSIEDKQFNRKMIPFDLGLKPGNYVKIEVSDNGIGIPNNIVDSVFEPYFTTKQIGEGTGLGLATVHGIVEKLSGKITVKSSFDTGTTFTIHIPANQVQRIEQSNNDENMPGGDESILLIDDEKSITKMNKRFLESLGYKTVEMNDSIDAMKLFESMPDQFDLIISDMTMPKMTGDKLAVELILIRPDIPVVLCTGYSKRMSEESASKIGVRAFLNKPIIKSDMAKTVRKVLDEAKRYE